jgi:NAD+ kinase
MIVGLYTNCEKDPEGLYTREISDFLKARGHVPVAWTDGEEAALDFMVVLGGDGTMLRAAQYAAPSAIPLLGINLGRVGFLTDAGKNEGLQAVEKVLAGNYTVQKRMMLSAGGKTALNDAVVKGGRLTRFVLSVDGKYLAEIRADGIVVATPTGSTAYNRSAGGAVLLPESEMLAVTPICPNDLSVRPWVLDGNCEIQISADCEASLYMDGEPIFLLAASQVLTVRRAIIFSLIIKTAS